MNLTNFIIALLFLPTVQLLANEKFEQYLEKEYKVLDLSDLVALKHEVNVVISGIANSQKLDLDDPFFTHVKPTPTTAIYIPLSDSWALENVLKMLLNAKILGDYKIKANRIDIDYPANPIVVPYFIISK